MTNIWRLHTKTDGKNVAEYCIKNGVIALGWSLCDIHIKGLEEEVFIKEEREKIKTIDDYVEIIEKYNIYGGKLNGNIRRLAFDVKTNDLIWLRNKGIYYLGRVTEKSSYCYILDEFSLENDATNQIPNIDWHEIGDISKVPGSLANNFIPRTTLQRINNNSIEIFSKLKYNEKINEEIYTDIKFDKDSFFYLLTSDDIEDLLALWLYKEKGYVTIPSTNKKSTELYEYVMVDPKTGNNIFAQVKQGSVKINANDYEHLDGEVWLLTTEGEVKNQNVSPKIKVANPEMIKIFALCEANYKLLPEKIKSWGKYYKRIS